MRANGNALRFVRVRAARLALLMAVETLRRLNIRSEVALQAGQPPRINLNGVWLSTAASNRYLKKQHPDGNEGAEMLEFLRAHGVKEPKAILDIGANVGEITLYFSKMFPFAKCVAVEPSPRNLGWFRFHRSIQEFPTRNIELVEAAVTQASGDEVLLYGYGAQSSLFTRTGQAIRVRSISLRELFDKFDVDRFDFVKVDIEGSEPVLAAAIRQVVSRATVWLVEFGPKSPRAEYLDLLQAFFDGGYVAVQRRDRRRFNTLESATAYFLHEVPDVTTDVYFLPAESVVHDEESL